MDSKLIILVVCLLGVALGENCPVFTWGSNSNPKPTFYSVSQDEFAEEMKPKAKNSMFVTFLEPELSNSDFACSKSSTRDSCFSNLKGVAPKTYYYRVENPVESLRQITLGRESAIVDANGNLDRDVPCQPGDELLIDLGVLNEDSTLSIQRSALLEKHDEIMSTVYKKLSENCKIDAFYTCSPSTTNANASKTRRRRAAANTATSGTMFRSGKDFLIFYTDLIIQEEGPDKKPVYTPITIADMSISEKNDTAFTVTLSGDTNKLSFLISLSGGYFKMSNLMFNNEKFHVPSVVNAPTDFSYTCGNQTFITLEEKSTKIIKWNSFQMQAPFDNNTPNNFNFGEPWYCVGFFSSGILAGLFVVFILLGIMAVGICWMLDINTMDRFDDPKGKTITINVNE